MSPPFKSIKALLALAENSNLEIHFSISTPYGLVVELSGDSLEVRLKEEDMKLLPANTAAQVKPEEPSAIQSTSAPLSQTEDQESVNEPRTVHVEPQVPVTQVGDEPLSPMEQQNSTEQSRTESTSVQAHKENPLKPGDQSEALPEYGPSLPGYKYCIWEDFGTNFLWYVWNWPANPEFCGEPVEDDDLLERYPKTWYKAYDNWVDRYTEAFRAHIEMNANNPVFNTAKELNLWEFEGTLLAAGLALQDGVYGVGYGTEKNDDSYAHEFEFERDGSESIGKTLERYIQRRILDQNLDIGV
ncbi:hypothetical protein HER10_EVM0000973 [Colletotrichum scovillei]|uniref:Uncharacterized protein n=1 Tax=Colletotrichum scovillei TaxID=1209932 RepID=A0A9P7U6Z7_9PEZI|nr:uncharacterized protein HER10_EVM0000973 [Colletotrichum scovillei]KAF4778180.1 hypothetical protein HER10_EVM0000973 [Colletotrichum scovillei]KAG7039850.1 hypothetical protein JMJ78_0011511 [Colletotrichum scovillei]KAG7042025.1 hypothetical protein JMJ77_0010132 [Colletotrichum scovillei]KAG7062056.1 hypothetical protein JMJ76_0006339 [Colletotrichum scovillei]